MEYYESVLTRISQQLSRVMQTTLTAELDRVSASTAAQRIQARKQRQQQQMGYGTLAADMEKLESMPMRDLVLIASTPAGRTVLHKSNSRMFPNINSVRDLWNSYMSQLRSTTPPSLRISVPDTAVSALFSSDAWKESMLRKSDFPELQVVVAEAPKLLHAEQKEEEPEQKQTLEFSKQADAAADAFVREVADALKSRDRVGDVQEVVQALTVARVNISGGIPRLRREIQDERVDDIRNTLTESLAERILPALRDDLGRQIVEDIQKIRRVLLQHENASANVDIDTLIAERKVLLENFIERFEETKEKNTPPVFQGNLPRLAMQLALDVHCRLGKKYAMKEQYRLEIKERSFDRDTIAAFKELKAVCPTSEWSKKQLDTILPDHEGFAAPAESVRRTLTSRAAVSLLVNTLKDYDLETKNNVSRHDMRCDTVLAFLDGIAELADDKVQFKRILTSELENDSSQIYDYYQAQIDFVRTMRPKKWLQEMVETQLAEVNTRVEEAVLAASNSTLDSAARYIENVGKLEADLQKWIVDDRLKSTWTRLVVDAAGLKATPELFKTLLDKTVPRTFVTLDKWCARGVPALLNGTRPK